MEPPDDPLGEAVWTVLNKTAICSVYFLAQASAPPYFPHFSFPFSLNFRGEHKPSVAGVS